MPIKTNDKKYLLRTRRNEDISQYFGDISVRNKLDNFILFTNFTIILFLFIRILLKFINKINMF